MLLSCTLRYTALQVIHSAGLTVDRQQGSSKPSHKHVLWCKFKLTTHKNRGATSDHHTVPSVRTLDCYDIIISWRKRWVRFASGGCARPMKGLSRERGKHFFGYIWIHCFSSCLKARCDAVLLQQVIGWIKGWFCRLLKCRGSSQ